MQRVLIDERYWSEFEKFPFLAILNVQYPSLLKVVTK